MFIKKNAIDGASGTYGGEVRCIQGGDLREKDHLEGLGIDGNIILIWIVKEGAMVWTGLI